MATSTSRSPVYKAASLPQPVPFNWTGLYIGGHFGGGLAHSQWTDNVPPGCINFPCSAIEAGSQNAVGPLGGLQLGYNWQFGHWVLGLEGQYTFAQLKGDHQNNLVDGGNLGPLFLTLSSVDRLTTKVDAIGTVAGRIGFASDLMDRTLVYLKGGAAYEREQYTDQYN